MSEPEMFAKLFDRNGQQVLVTKDEDDDGNPILRVRFRSNIEGHGIAIALTFKESAELDAWEVLDRAFDTMDEAKAFDIRDNSPAVHL